MGERRGQGVEGWRGDGEGRWLARCPYVPPSHFLPLPCFFYLLSVPMLMSRDVQGDKDRKRERGIHKHGFLLSSLFSGQRNPAIISANFQNSESYTQKHYLVLNVVS